MSEPIRIPVTVIDSDRHGIASIRSEGHVTITTDHITAIVRTIAADPGLANAIVRAGTPPPVLLPECSVPASDRCWPATGMTITTTNPDGSLKPVALRLAADGSVVDADAGYEAAVMALALVLLKEHAPEYEGVPTAADWKMSPFVIRSRAILVAIKAGKVPGIYCAPPKSDCYDSFHKAERDQALSDLAACRAELAAMTDRAENAREDARVVRIQLDGKDRHITQLSARRDELATIANDCRSQAEDLLRRWGGMERDRDAANARVVELERAASAWRSDMESAGRMCGQRDDEYPLEAVARFSADAAQWKERAETADLDALLARIAKPKPEAGKGEAP